MLFSSTYLPALLAGAALLASPAAWAQRNLPAKAPLDQCFRVLGKDSVGFFYSDDYVLTPPGCATIRRHTRLDSAGRFLGYVRDYRMTNNQLLLQGSYREGRKEGVFETYHATGELAARGRYLAGRQVGDWAYWYPSGRPRQILSFRNGQDPLIQQFWEDSGKQLVKDGNGTWYRQELGLQLQGAVVQGIPDGRWQLRRLVDQTLVARETFVKGHFRNGVLIEQMEYYNDESRLDLADWDTYSKAEAYELGPECLTAK
ncbi:toxin-antitoxin system YwqK family antitoxin [Hymenobacter psychrotolerans]|uniref:Antitoxin component YwqK of the YwqJK toxin-antitoxin module n=1 Tax=Hymenobacter psychrotolerans DSM 18569 TaxID=1121959 RepID=A0A1M7CB09_9BACT|nr:hypothetical protein [Hymenobacter psychrotolerans]SHL64079.1 Antitoxin component YwqK of the YwqJK toxin-antitoxin module [Hymenobacter psychrotolerans DSM 18569]